MREDYAAHICFSLCAESQLFFNSKRAMDGFDISVNPCNPVKDANRSRSGSSGQPFSGEKNDWYVVRNFRCMVTSAYDTVIACVLCVAHRCR